MSFFEDELFEYEFDEMYEHTFSNPIKKFKETIEKIRKAKPTEFDDDSKIKEFVDSNYGSIMDTAAILEKEPESIRKSEISTAIVVGISMLTYIGSIVSLGFGTIVMLPVAIISMIFSFVYSIITCIIQYMRISNDTKVSNDLSKIRASLKKIDTKKLPENYRIKIVKMITAIDDAETEISSRVKVSKESVIDLKLSIYESYTNGEIDEIEKDILLERLEEKEMNEDNNIFSNLYEATKGAHKKLMELDQKRITSKKTEEKYHKLTEEIKKMNRVIGNKKATENQKNIARKRIAEIKQELKELLSYHSPVTPKDYKKDEKKYNDFLSSFEDNDAQKIADTYKSHSNSRNNMNKKILSWQRKNGNPDKGNVKESVDNLKLQVYEACENGNITEEEKNIFLEYLNLDNYECKEVM